MTRKGPAERSRVGAGAVPEPAPELAAEINAEHKRAFGKVREALEHARRRAYPELGEKLPEGGRGVSGGFRQAERETGGALSMSATAVRRHEVFAREYVLDHNGKQAAIRAGYSAKTAESQASRMLRNVKVQKLVAQLEAAAGQRVNVDTDELLRTSLALAHVDPADIFGLDGSVRPIHEIPRAARLAIAGVDVTEAYEGTGKKRRLVSRKIKTRLLDKNAALDRLFRYQGMFGKDNAQKSDVIREFMEAVSGKSRGLPGAGTQPSGRS